MPSGFSRRSRPLPRRSHPPRLAPRRGATMRTVALAAAIGLIATAIAAGVAIPGRTAVTAFDWSFYDLLPARVPSGQPPIAIVRDAASESRFGPGIWDRALLARLVTNLSQAGAAVIGLEAALDQPS